MSFALTVIIFSQMSAYAFVNTNILYANPNGINVKIITENVLGKVEFENTGKKDVTILIRIDGETIRNSGVVFLELGNSTDERIPANSVCYITLESAKKKIPIKITVTNGRLIKDKKIGRR